jgi:hypothetical protein
VRTVKVVLHVWERYVHHTSLPGRSTSLATSQLDAFCSHPMTTWLPTGLELKFSAWLHLSPSRMNWRWLDIKKKLGPSIFHYLCTCARIQLQLLRSFLAPSFLPACFGLELSLVKLGKNEDKTTAAPFFTAKFPNEFPYRWRPNPLRCRWWH